MDSTTKTGTHESALSPTRAWTILAAEGFASLSVEILGLRAMVPYAGTPVPVTSILLAAYLGALALGYHRGEQAATRLGGLSGATAKLREAAGNRLMKATIWTVVATGHGLPLVVFNLTQEHVAVGVVLYSTLGIAPIGMWLAESIMLIDRARRRSANEHGTGSTLAMSTAGNVAGALLTAWVILSTLGMAGATALVALVSGGAAVAAHRRAWGWETALFIVALLGIYGYHEQTEYRARTAYADYQLVENKTNGTRELIINRSRASTDDGSGTGHPYIEAIETALCSLEIKQVAVLGAAGRTLGEGADCDIQPTFVDIDPAQAEMSQELLERPPQGTLQIADARAWLRNNEVLWPAIVADAYSHRASLPTHLATVEAFEAMRDDLAADGLLFVNILGSENEAKFRTRIDRTIRRVFADCETWSRSANAEPAAWAADDDEQHDNLLYRCRRSELDGDEAVYVDDRQSIDIDRGLQ